MDFKNFDTKKTSDEGRWCPIYSPDGTQLVAEILMAGRDSKILKRRQQELAKKNQSKKKITPAEEEQDTLITLATCTLNWRMIDEDGKKGKDGIFIDAGEELKCSFDVAKDFYERYTFVAEQVVEFMADRANFLLR